jgi:hypothetical protein
MSRVVRRTDDGHLAALRRLTRLARVSREVGRSYGARTPVDEHWRKRIPGREDRVKRSAILVACKKALGRGDFPGGGHIETCRREPCQTYAGQRTA